MSRRALYPREANEVKGLSRMAPGGRLWSESPFSQFRPRVEPEPPGTAPLQAHWKASGTKSGLGTSPGSTGTVALDPDFIYDQSGDITEFMFWSARRLHGITVPPMWTILDSQYSSGFGVDAIPGTPEGATATWEWGIAMHQRSVPTKPTYEIYWTRDEFPTTAASQPPNYAVKVTHLMFRGHVGGTWSARRASGAFNALVNFPPFPSDMTFRFHALMSRAFYASWSGTSPPTVPQALSMTGFANAGSSATRPYQGANARAWDTEAQTKYLWMDSPPVTGSYQHNTIGAYGKSAHQLLFVGWSP